MNQVFSKMNLRHAVIPILLTFWALPLVAATKPNIVIILADDLGFGDVQANNPQRGKIPTPNIDRLAGQGMR
ncbi:MAG: arylsulfatase, partial [Isosphaeraceae bacterium]